MTWRLYDLNGQLTVTETALMTAGSIPGLTDGDGIGNNADDDDDGDGV